MTEANEENKEPQSGPEQEKPAEEAAQEAGQKASGEAKELTPEEQIAQIQAQAAEHYDLYIRAAAELENTRRRCEEEIAKVRKFAVSDFAEQMLPVVDSMEKALEAHPEASPLRDGLEATYRQLVGALERAGLKKLAPVGEKFDPNTQQAIMMVASADVPAGCVAQVFQPGWTIAGRILRPAMVAVAKAS